jgi:hypothetical protein
MRPMTRAMLIGLTVAVWLGIGVVIAVFFVARAFEDGSEAATPITITPKLLIPTEPRQLGRPPTRHWPRLHACPESLATGCPSGQMALVATVNFRRDTVVNGALVGYSRLALCRWPVGGARSCQMVSKTGVVAKAESAMYAIP